MPYRGEEFGSVVVNRPKTKFLDQRPWLRADPSIHLAVGDVHSAVGKRVDDGTSAGPVRLGAASPADCNRNAHQERSPKREAPIYLLAIPSCHSSTSDL